MDFRTFIERFDERYPFSVKQIRLQEKGFFLQQLHNREKNGWIKNIIRWWWISDKALKNNGIWALIANSIYEPSYLGLQWALRYYNLIPEWVFEYTCCTSKKTQRYNTVVGFIVYRSIHVRYYRWYDLANIGNYKNIRISSPEKTICDYIYLHNKIVDQDDFEEMRINAFVWKEIWSNKLLIEYSKRYPLRVQEMVKIFISYVTNNA